MTIELTGNRRTFLKNAAIFGGAAISLLTGRKLAAAVPVPDDPPAKASNGAGYQLTEHIKKYYETARS
jgi:hypothetical protein